MSKFYLVQKGGSPAIWQSDLQHINGLLRRHAGFVMASDEPAATRKEALARLRQLFPGHRPVKQAD